MFTPKNTPFVKWAGGKGQLLDRLVQRMPENYDRYFEPFLGGGALLLGLQPKNAIVNDINKQLLNVYIQLKENADEVVKAIDRLDERECDLDYYLEIRERYNEKIISEILDVETAAMFIWINKHCFNGLYRVNAKGKFNVPWNKNTGKTAYNETNLKQIGDYLKNNNVQILNVDFENAVAEAKEGDFVYFDSPYIPESETANFTDYTKDGFGYDDHVRLANLFKALDKKGVKVMLSNNDVPLVYKLYEGFNIENTDVQRMINSKVNKRTGKEVIITNYGKGLFE